MVAKFIELLLRSRTEMVLLELDRTGVPFLDRFAARIAQRSNEEWLKWQLCRFTEIALEIMCYGLSQLIRPLPTPETLFKEGQAPTFGLFRELALKSAYELPGRANVWGATFFKSVLKDRVAAQALEEVNAQRNHFAHGRKSLGVTEIKKLAVQGLKLQAWPQIPDKDGELILADWHPWSSRRRVTASQGCLNDGRRMPTL